METASAATTESSPQVPVTHTRLNGPIRQLNLMRKSLLFAELSGIAYSDEEAVRRAVEPIGLHYTVEFFDRDGAQAYRLENDTDCVIACRGTEPNEMNDVKADIDAAMVAVGTLGRVHRGFNRETDDLWPQIEQSLRSNSTKAVWFTGHSLGGAIATVCAGRCFLSDIPSMPAALFTYGSPRVGNRRFINYCNIEHYRWVHNNDIVPRLPPMWFGFRHSGKEMYLNRNGELQQLTAVQKAVDRLRGFSRSLLRWKIDHLSDHLMDGYIAGILQTIERFERGTEMED
jgi:triacylglycerol lipase